MSRSLAQQTSSGREIARTGAQRYETATPAQATAPHGEPHTPCAAPAVQTIPDGVVSLGDHARHARSQFDTLAQAYFDGAAADEITLRENRSAWEQIHLLPRVLRDLRGGHTQVQLLGRTLAHPVLLAPVAYQRLAHVDGERASAHAAAALGAGMVLSMQSSVSMKAIADIVMTAPQRGPLWFQLYMQHDRGFVRELVLRAEQHGFEALVLTVDAPVHGARDRERRVGFQLPPHVNAVNLSDIARTPAPAGTQHGLCRGLIDIAPSWRDIEWLQQNTRLPILLKGVLHPDDARQARDAGLAGLIVSNHGGRTLDTVVPSAWALPRIANTLAGAIPILVDGGIRRGTDVLKAMALGASAVLIGRPYIHGLANAGAVGVAHVLRLLRDELEIAMALSGCASLADAGPDLLVHGTAPLRANPSGLGN